MIEAAAMTFVLTALWQGALIALTVWGAIRIFRIQSAAIRAAVWSAAFFSAAILPLSIFLPGAQIDTGAFTPAVFESVLTSESAPAVTPSVATPTIIQGQGGVATNMLASITLFVWATGFFLRLMILLRDAAAITRLRRDSEVVSAPKQFEVPASVEFRLHDEVKSPLATGIFRPVILFPASMMKNGRVQTVRGALAHECAHIRRGDLVANFAESMVLCLFWWNLPLQWMRSAIAENREMACDDQAIIETRSAGDYAMTLIACAESALTNRHPSGALAVAGDKSSFTRRITRLAATEYKPAVKTGIPRTVLTVSALTLATAYAATAAPRVEISFSSGASSSIVQVAPGSSAEALGRLLVEAVLNKDMQAAQQLMESGADINAVLEYDGTPLIAAVNENNLEFAGWLIAKNADVNAYARYDETALISAARNSSVDMVRLLIDAGADVNQSAQTENGVLRSPLGEARRLKRRGIENILINAGASQ